jgi:hypothetical protein
MSEKLSNKIAVIGIDIGKNSFHIVGQDPRGVLVLRQKWSRGQVETRLSSMQPCLIGMEACVKHVYRLQICPSHRHSRVTLGSGCCPGNTIWRREPWRD